MTGITVDELAPYIPKKRVQAALRRERLCEMGTYAEFTAQLYDDIDELIFDMQAGRELRQDDGEDRLTGDILGGLRRSGYTATADSKTGGHVDLSVILGEFSWIGEAKKDGNFQEGLLQLTTRYVPASGNYAHNQGGLIFYFVESSDARGKLNRWRDELIAKGYQCVDCERNALAFFFEQILQGSGTSFNVRTMAVALHHKPGDRSGRETAMRKVRTVDE